MFLKTLMAFVSVSVKIDFKIYIFNYRKVPNRYNNILHYAFDIILHHLYNSDENNPIF